MVIANSREGPIMKAREVQILGRAGQGRVVSLLMTLMAGGSVAGACDGGANDGPRGSATKGAFIASYCDVFRPCCAAAALPADGVRCRALIDAVTPAGYDPAMGAACLAQLQAASRAPGFCDDIAGAQLDACQTVFSSSGGGGAQPGDACLQTPDCATPDKGTVSCASSYINDMEVRRCQVQIHGAEGDGPCIATFDGGVQVSGIDASLHPTAFVCDRTDGLFCDFLAGTCTRTKPMGDNCLSDWECAGSAYCNVMGSQLQCTPRMAVGMSCGGAAGVRCVEGAYCDTSSICQSLLAVGASCLRSEQCLSDSCINGTCGSALGAVVTLGFVCGSK
jgi:hypothetical protein